MQRKKCRLPKWNNNYIIWKRATANGRQKKCSEFYVQICIECKLTGVEMMRGCIQPLEDSELSCWIYGMENAMCRQWVKSQP